ncbi:MAG TPA: GNAT family N-acetyltransferase, partial [Polyangiaceae bacterium]|nr:GNAT family N-acetyltransferase [Polyangiaceae bacterium]
ELRPSEFTNDPTIIARNDDMIAINSALGVDLTGQVAADTLQGRFFSGIGGQVDFVRGAARSKRGKPIIALPSTAKSGKASRIVAAHEAGAGIVTSRGDVRYVVTEYGIADLWGKNIRERAMALIEIAHPDFRAELLGDAKERHYVFSDQRRPRAAILGGKENTSATLEGRRLTVRPLRMSDEERLQDLFYGLSEKSAYSRFFQYRKAFPHDEMQRLVDLDYEQNMALVVQEEHSPSGEVIALARYDLNRATGLGDIAFVVRDDWQGKGVGKLLMQRMCAVAKARGVAGFTADVLATNAAMLSIFHQSALAVSSELDAGVYHLTLRFPDRSDSMVPDPP